MKFLSASILAVLGYASSAEAAFEWAGVFPVNDASHQWSMQADDSGNYPDPAMKVVFLPVSEAVEAAVHSNEAMAETMINGDCKVIEAGETIGPIAAGGSCFDLHVGAGKDSIFPMMTENIAALAIFAQHFPIEFERDMHYFKDSAMADIEPVFQEPEGDHAHDHNHGGAPAKKCACAFEEMGLKVDCADTQAMSTALNNLETKGCKDNCKNEGCEANWLIVQAHHDHCPEAGLPLQVENGFHDFDHCPGCSIVRQLIPGADQCPTVSCTDNSGNDAYARLLSNGCNIDGACPAATCKEDYMILRMVHDTCDHEALTQGAEEGLHTLEESCAAFNCNLPLDVIEQTLKCTAEDKPNGGDDGHGDHGGDHGGEAAFEWAGVFPVNDATHQWSMQADDSGKYPDPAMKVVFLPVSQAVEAAVHSNEAMAATMINGDCKVIEAGETIGPIAAGGSCFDLHVGSGKDSIYPMMTENIAALAIFAQHFPIEFERDMHYFKDSAMADIEPVFQEPDGDHAHDHDHGGSPVEKCACVFKKMGLKLDCDNTQAMLTALNNLQTNECRENCKNEGCKENWLIVQAHHDHCPEAGLPLEVENGFHDFDSCPGCTIVHQIIPGAKQCPTVSCTDGSGNMAYQRLLSNGCDGTCSAGTCEDDYMILRQVHDSCEHDALTSAAEEGLHDLEKPCASFNCNLPLDVIEKTLTCDATDVTDDKDDHSGHDHSGDKDDTSGGDKDDHSGHDHDHNDHDDDKPEKVDSGTSNLAAGVVVAMAVAVASLI